MRSKIQKFMVIPVFLLFLCMVTVCVSTMLKVPVYAQQTDKPQTAITIELNKKNTEENVPFQMTNMFPGDSVTQNYRINVSYGKSWTEEFAYEITAGLSISAGNECQNKSWLVDFSWEIEEVLTDTGTIRVNFRATVRNDGGNLLEMLDLKVRMADTGELLYDGALADMPIIWHEMSIESKDDPTKPSEPGSEENPTEPSEPENEEDSTEPSEPEYGDDENGMIGIGGVSLTDPPTGDDSRIFMWLVITCASIAAIILVIAKYHKRRLVIEKSNIWRKLFSGIFVTVLLMLGLTITTIALVYQKVTVEENLFVTGQVKISLNDDQPVFREDILFEPGMVVEKEFTLSNDSTCDVHYRLYFTNIEGEFAEALQVEVLDRDEAIFEGTLKDMNGQKSQGAQGVLEEGEARVMTIVFRVPKDCKNEMQGQTILFDLNADAVQAVNNPDGLFE